MREYLEWVKNPFVAGLIAGLVVVIVTFIDSYYNEKYTMNDTYLKIFLSSSIVTTVLVFYAKSSLDMSGGTSEHQHHSGGKHYERVYTNNPDF